MNIFTETENKKEVVHIYNDSLPKEKYNGEKGLKHLIRKKILLNSNKQFQELFEEYRENQIWKYREHNGPESYDCFGFFKNGPPDAVKISRLILSCFSPTKH